MQLDVELFGGLPFSGETVVLHIVTTDILFQGGVVDKTIRFDLRTKQFDTQLVLNNRDVHDAFDILATVLIQCHDEVTAPFHGDVTADDVDQAPGRILAKQGSLRTTQHFDALHIEVLH